jgi:hypothetical protein
MTAPSSSPRASWPSPACATCCRPSRPPGYPIHLKSWKRPSGAISTSSPSCRTATAAFLYWQRGRDSIPYNTIHVAHALQRAEAMGFDGPGRPRPALDYLRTDRAPLSRLVRPRGPPTLSAYALYTRHLMGDTDPAKAASCSTRQASTRCRSKRPPGSGRCSSTTPTRPQLEAIRRHVNNRAVETAGAANFTTAYGEDAYVLLHSDRRTDAVILDALIADDPGQRPDPQGGQRVAGAPHPRPLVEHQENVFVLLALDRYFNVFEAQTPEFVARIWLGETYLGGHAYSGRTTERHETTIPMSYLVDVTAGRHPAPHPQQGGARPALLPPRTELRADRPQPRPPRHGFHRPARLRGGRRPR